MRLKINGQSKGNRGGNWIFLLAAHLMYARNDKTLSIVVIVSGLITIGALLLIDDNIEVR